MYKMRSFFGICYIDELCDETNVPMYIFPSNGNHRDIQTKINNIINMFSSNKKIIWIDQLDETTQATINNTKVNPNDFLICSSLLSNEDIVPLSINIPHRLMLGMTIDEIYDDIMVHDDKFCIKSMINLTDLVMVTNYKSNEPVRYNLKFIVNQTNWTKPEQIISHLQNFNEVSKVYAERTARGVCGRVFFSDYSEYQKCLSSRVKYYNGLFLFYSV